MAKKAIIIGGSSGIGYSIVLELVKRQYDVTILDINQPRMLAENSEWLYLDMGDLNEELLKRLASDSDVSLLMITAGIGRAAGFSYLHTAEIEKLLKIDAVSVIKIMRLFYDRIHSANPFFCGVMGSIAGLVSSPLFSVYAAAKAAVCRFVESVNIELEMEGAENRILNVCPGSIKGTRFNGGENQPELTAELAESIIGKLMARDVLYIPDEAVYGDVLRRYQADPHGFGRDSYQYKISSGRLRNEKHVVIGYLSGTFDLFHVGHLNLLRKAKQQCDYLIVGVHGSGKWKGKETFIPLEERKEIVGACRYVDKVVDSCTEDSDAWDLWHYDKLFVGSDYKGTERFRRYEEYFADKGVTIVYFPYTQGTSSTQIRKTVLLKTKNMPESGE